MIIPAWNGSVYLPACLDALLAQEDRGSEVIVVDNASADGSADLVAARYPQVKLIRNRRNQGFAGGCNAGIQASRGQVLVLLNQDTRVYPGWLAALVDKLQAPEVGAVGCKILYPDARVLQHAGGCVEWPLGMTHHCGRGEQDEGQWDVARQVDFVTGASVAFRREVVDRVGPLDEGFWPGYYEDVDFCFTVREAGYEVWYTPEAVLTHEETASIGDRATLVRALHRGRLRFLLKHAPLHRFLEEFVRSERADHTRACQGLPDIVRQMAYLDAIAVAATVLPRHRHADMETTERVLLAFQELYLEPVSDYAASDLSLREFEFRSATPVIGPVLARLRSLWYGVAARWGVRYLTQQQTIVNQRQETVNQETARTWVSLSREIARLVVDLEDGTDERAMEGTGK